MCLMSIARNHETVNLRCYWRENCCGLLMRWLSPLPAFVPLQIVETSRSGQEGVPGLGYIRNLHYGYGSVVFHVAPARGERLLLLDGEVALVLEY